MLNTCNLVLCLFRLTRMTWAEDGWQSLFILI